MEPGTFLAAEAIKGFVGLAVRVFGDMADIKLDEPFRQLLFSATKKYVQTYTERHGHVQVLGMSKPIPLDDIYSGAWMLDSAALKSYASQSDLEETYRNKEQRRFRDYNCPKRNGIEIARDKDCARLIVLGDPGIGKSTFLRKVGLEALKGNAGDYQLPHIPVFLELKRFRSTEVDLKASITEEFENCGFPSPEGFTENALKKGQLLLLFDGLDEVPADNLNTIIESIQNLVDRYSENRFIASCRIAAYHTYFKRVSTVAIAEFDDDQIERFIYNWFSSKLDREYQTAEQCWERLQQPVNKGSKELAQSPLLLTFICLVYNKSLTVPSNRTTLYSRALDILLEEWATEKRVGRGEIYEGFHADLEKELLAKIAYEGFENDQLFFSKEQLIKYITVFLGDTLDAPKNLNASAVLEAIEVQQGILVERATDVYSFSHLTLQEFLAAKYIVTRNLQKDLVELYLLDFRWREVFLLVAGLMKGGAIRFLQQLEGQTQTLSKNPQLKGLLAWAEVKTSHTASGYSGEVKRIFALVLIFYLALAITWARTSDFDLSGDFARARVCILASDLTSDLTSNPDFVLASTSGLALALATARASGSNNTLANNPSLVLANNLGLALASAKFTMNNQPISDVDLQPLISYLERSFEASKSSAEELTSISSSSLDISPKFFDLSTDDLQAFTNYLSTYQLMIDCSKQASGLSAQQWEAIKQRMFLPPQS